MSKKILITGASGAFGSLTCKTLVEKGHQVVGTMRSTKGKNEAVAKDLQASGILLVEMDVTIEASVTEGISKTIDSLGGLDVVINNAGIGSTGILELFTAEDLQKVFDVNVFGVQRVMRAVLPTLRAQNGGTIIHISSCIGRLTMPFLSMYSASKYALESLAEGYRAELSGFGIESCIIEPGGMPTAFMDSMLQPSDMTRAEQYGDLAYAPKASLQGYIENLEANPLQRPQKIADAVEELLALPMGEKPFRTVVDFMGLKEPLDQYNSQYQGMTQQLYTAFGMGNMLSLNKN